MPHFPTPVQRNREVPVGLQRLCRMILRMMGWRIDRWELPDSTPKAVVLGEHHTANMDAILMIFMVTAMGRRLRWLVKSELNKPIIGTLVRWTGGIFVDRHAANGLVGQAVEMIDGSERMFLAMAPSGTRSKTNRWRTGFYYMALQADVPVGLGYLDYKHKVGGIGKLIQLSGDMKADERIFREFYKDIHARHPQNISDIVLDPSNAQKNQRSA